MFRFDTREHHSGLSKDLTMTHKLDDELDSKQGTLNEHKLLSQHESLADILKQSQSGKEEDMSDIENQLY